MSEKCVRCLAALVHLILYMGLGSVASCWFFDSVIPGALLGLGAYLLIILVVIIRDIVAINRELAAFRKGEGHDRQER